MEVESHTGKIPHLWKRTPCRNPCNRVEFPNFGIIADHLAMWQSSHPNFFGPRTPTKCKIATVVHIFVSIQTHNQTCPRRQKRILRLAIPTWVWESNGHQIRWFDHPSIWAHRHTTRLCNFHHETAFATGGLLNRTFEKHLEPTTRRDNPNGGGELVLPKQWRTFR